MGALTSKPYAFQARSWELRSVDSIDLVDAEGAHIRVDLRGNRVLRVLPRINYTLNLEWISDRTRFFYDSLSLQRVQEPLLLGGSRGAFSLRQLFTTTIIPTLESLAKGQQLPFLAFGRYLDRLSGLGILNMVHNTTLGRFDLGPVGSMAHYDVDFPAVRAVPVYDQLDSFPIHILLGTSLRFEAPLLNLRLRKAVALRKIKVFSLGALGSSNYPVTLLGNSSLEVSSLLEGKSRLSRLLSRSTSAICWVGASFTRCTFAPLLQNIFSLLEVRLPHLNVVHLPDSVTAPTLADTGLATGVRDVLRQRSFEKKLLLDFGGLRPLNRTFLVRQWSFVSHREVGLLLPQLIFPVPSVQEKAAVYYNSQFQAQSTSLAAAPAGEWVKNEVDLAEAVSHLLTPSTPDSQNQKFSRFFNFQSNEQGSFISGKLARLLEFSFAGARLDNGSLGAFFSHPYHSDALHRASRHLTVGLAIFRGRLSNFSTRS